MVLSKYSKSGNACQVQKSPFRMIVVGELEFGVLETEFVDKSPQKIAVFVYFEGKACCAASTVRVNLDKRANERMDG